MDQLSTGVPVMIHLETHIKQDEDVSDYRYQQRGLSNNGLSPTNLSHGQSILFFLSLLKLP